jgi:hypothetical protein
MGIEDVGLGDFGALINAMEGNKGGDGDTGSMFPRSDATDMNNGARFIPGEVTLARRAGKKVEFNQSCRNQCCWFWTLPDGQRIYHFERSCFERIRDQENGACSKCGNDFISGGKMSAARAERHSQKVGVKAPTMADIGKMVTDTMETGNVSGAIEASESAGQRQLVESDVLPTQISAELKKELESAGVKFGDPVENDPLFTYVELPEGWKKQATDHAMWSNLVDDEGKVRAAIFYKAAFYDRRASVSAP